MNVFEGIETLEISVVIPVYNSEKTLPELAQRLTAALKRLGAPYEMVFVDDGSRDGSAGVLSKEAKADPHIKFVKLSRNFGQHPALTAGLTAATGRWIVTMDDDLQNPPEEIEKLYAKALEGYDVVCGARVERQDTLFRRWGSKLANWLMHKLFHNLSPDSIGAFRIMSRRVVDEILRLPETHTYLAALVAWVGFPQTSIQVRHDASRAGRSRYSLSKLIFVWVNIAFGFSGYPLRLMVSSGFILSGLAFLILLRAFYLYFIADKPLLGYTSIFAGQMLFFGIILFCLGIIGEYLGRVYTEAQRRPYFIVDRETSYPPLTRGREGERRL